MKVLAGRREKILFFRDKGRTFFLKLDPNQRLRVKVTGKEIITEGRSKVRPAIRAGDLRARLAPIEWSPEA